MRLFLCLVIVLACVAITTGKKSRCERWERKFGKRCLTNGYTPTLLQNCEIGDGAFRYPKWGMRKCGRIENKIMTAHCDVKACKADSGWCSHENSFLYSYAGDSFDNLEDAQEACLKNARCNGITQVYYHPLYQL